MLLASVVAPTPRRPATRVCATEASAGAISGNAGRVGQQQLQQQPPRQGLPPAGGTAVRKAPGGTPRRPPAARQQRAPSPQEQRPDKRTEQFAAALAAGQLDRCLELLRPPAAKGRRATPPAAAPSPNAAAAAPAAAAPSQTPRPRRLLNPQHHSDLLKACIAGNRAELAIEYSQLVQGPAWVHLLKECARQRAHPAALQVAAALRALGPPPDAHTAGSLITAHSAAGQLGQALEVFSAAWARPENRCLVVCNCAIAACASARDWQAAQQVLASMQEAGIDPDTITYNSLIKAAGAAGLMEEAVQLYRQMREEGLPPSQVTFTALFNAAARTYHEDMPWLLQTFDDMEQYGLLPNDYILSAFFSAASYAPCTPAERERVFGALSLLRSHATPNDTVYTALLVLTTRQAIPERAIDIWNAVKEDQVPLTPHLLSALFTACTAGGSPELADLALQAHASMAAIWQQHGRKGPGAERMERDMRVAYNALLRFLGDATSGSLQEALDLYNSMKRHGPKPDIVTYNTLIAACSWRGDVATAMQLFSYMVDAELEATEETCGAMLNCFAKARDVMSAVKVFESLKLLGIAPNLLAYTSLIDACVREGGESSLQLAFELLDQMREQGVQPSAVTYGCLLVACQRQRDVGRALELYRQACDEGVLPTDQMHDILLSACTAAGRLDEALELVKRLAREHSALQEHSLNSLVRALAAQHPDRALRMLSLMQTLGMRPSRRTHLTLVAACARASMAAEAYRLYSGLRGQGLEADGPAGSALICALCRGNQLEQAVTVYTDMMAGAWGLELRGLPPAAATGGGLGNRAQMPDASALAELAQAHAASGQLREALKYYKQLRRSAKGLAAAAASSRRMFELLLEGLCRANRLERALEVFDDFKGAAEAWATGKYGAASSANGTPTPEQAGAKTGDSSSTGSSSGSSPRSAGTAGAGAAATAGLQRPGGRPGMTPAAAPSGAAAAPEGPGEAAEQDQAAERDRRYPRLSNVTLAFLEACCRSSPEHAWRVYDVCAVMRQQGERKRQAHLERPAKQSHHFLDADFLDADFLAAEPPQPAAGRVNPAQPAAAAAAGEAAEPPHPPRAAKAAPPLAPQQLLASSAPQPPQPPVSRAHPQPAAEDPLPAAAAPAAAVAAEQQQGALAQPSAVGQQPGGPVAPQRPAAWLT